MGTLWNVTKPTNVGAPVMGRQQQQHAVFANFMTNPTFVKNQSHVKFGLGRPLDLDFEFTSSKPKW